MPMNLPCARYFPRNDAIAPPYTRAQILHGRPAKEVPEALHIRIEAAMRDILNLSRQRFKTNGFGTIPGRHDDHIFNRIMQLPHIARPFIALHRRHHLIGELNG